MTKREEGEENQRLIKCKKTREVENKRGREMMNESNRERLIVNTNKMIARVIIR